MEGTRVGPYTVERKLGTGGMGTVYLAAATGDRVALKVLHPQLLEKPGFFERFLREADVGRQIDHENVVRTLDADDLVQDGVHHRFLVMEYVEGRTLRDLLDDLGTVPEALLREIAAQITAGLRAIHEAGIVHRDMKPENVLITEDHQVRIMDLGVARLVEESVALTRQGQFAGSLLYAAPEQFRGGEIGPAADLYSLGVVLYELATGHNPFWGDQAAAVLRAHLQEVPRPASERNSEVSPFLSELTSWLLAKEPSARPDGAALAALLEEGEGSVWWATREGEIKEATGHLPRIPVRRETELCGRADELELLRGAWRQARGGQGATLLLEGETGIGKSRLVDAFLAEMEGEDVHVLYGSYPPSGGMGGISDAIIEKFGRARLADALAPYLTATPALVPAFAAVLKHETPPEGSEPVSAEALVSIAVHLMQALAAEKPLVWVVDDLHFAEPDSREIVLALARALEEHRVLLVGTSRPGLPEEELASFSRTGSFRRIPLDRLGARGVIQLLRGALRSEALAVKLGGVIALKSDGVPFFVFEMIRALKEGDFISELPDGMYIESRVVQEIQVPSAVRDLVEARLGDLAKEERELLDAAAVQGHEFDPDLVARVLSRKRIEVLQALAELERRRGVIRAEGPLCTFDHHQIQEVVYADLPEWLRCEYHALLAEAVAEREGVPAGGSAEVAGETAELIARHHLHGSRPEGARPFLDAALEHLRSSWRTEAVNDLTRRALAVPGLLEGEARITMLLARAAVLVLTCDREEERPVLDEALRLAERAGDRVLISRSKQRLGWHLTQVGRLAEAREVLEESVRSGIDAGDRKAEGTAVSALGNVLLRLGRHAEADDCNQRALDIAREVGDRHAEAVYEWNIAVLKGAQGRHEEAHEHYERSHAIGTELGDPHWEGSLASIHHDLGLLAEARDDWMLALSAYRRVGDRFWEATALESLGVVHLTLGALKEAREYLLSTRRGAREIWQPRLEAAAAFGLALVPLWEGDRELGGDLLVRALELGRGCGEDQLVARALLRLGLYEADGGNAEEARAALEEARELAERSEAHADLVLATCAAALHTGERRAAALAAYDEHASHLLPVEDMEARFLLWRLTDARAHLEEAHRRLMHLVEHAPEEYRESMLANVPLHRDISDAWKEAGL